MVINFRFRIHPTLDQVQLIHWTYTRTGAIGFQDDREDFFQEPGTDPPYDVTGKNLTILLLHGRKTPDEELKKSWGFDGGKIAIIGSVISVDADGIHFDNTHLPLVDGMLHVTSDVADVLGIRAGYFGDMEIEEQKGT